jgi:hypothetical protein
MTAIADGGLPALPVPYTAPTLVLRRLPPPALEDLLGAYPAGLTSAEVARVMADTTAAVDRAGAEQALTRLVASGRARRRALGDDALWT